MPADPAGPRDTASDLGERGRALWSAARAEGPLSAGAEQTLLEACRIADRLDTLHAILRGDDDGWMRLDVRDDGDRVTVTVDGALAEARAQALALKALLYEVRTSRGKTAPTAREASSSDDLAARRAARRAAAGL